VPSRPLPESEASLTSIVRFAGFDAPAGPGAGLPRFRFGIVTDPQYAPFPPWRTRYFANSLAKLTETIAAFNREDLQFVATLGDLVEQDWENFAAVLPVYDALQAPHVLMLGNHDFKVAADRLDSVRRMIGAPRAYYDFAGGGYRFVVLDGNEISLFANRPGSANYIEAETRLARMAAAGAANAQVWNGGISDAQFAWVGETLEAARSAGERVIVFSHYPVYPPNDHNLCDDRRLVDLLTGYDNLVAFFSGHNHDGNYGRVGGTHFVNFRGMVETPDTASYAVVEAHDDRLEIRGYGLEQSRTLAI
jgi:3',5'-cyclic AMP phosphodiesterase CpdA